MTNKKAMNISDIIESITMNKKTDKQNESTQYHTESQDSKKQLGIYVHIPFCVQKCAYCDFLSLPAEDETKEKYVKALNNEIRITAEQTDLKDYCVKSVFIGGGTPSILNSSLLIQIMETLYELYDIGRDAEITIECNPGTVDRMKLNDYRKSGINRISFGLQSAQNNELKILGRIHTFEDLIKSFEDAQKAGFDNMNLDLMSALPNQTFESWKDTLNKAVNIGPQHISAYSLILEENTILFDLYSKKGLTLPGEDTEREMYYFTNEFLNEAGYGHYEISNYARKGFESIHNLSYWERTDYLGFGAGAASLFQECRYSNIRSIDEYIQLFSDTAREPCGILIAARAERNALSNDERMEEYMYLGLRKIKGVSLKTFEELYGIKAMHIYGKVIDKYTDMNMLEIEEGKLRLTKKGIDVSNVIMSEFLIN